MTAAICPEPPTKAPRPAGLSPDAPKRNHHQSARRQAIEMQALLHNDAKNAVKPGERAVVVRAWCDLNEEVRKLAMKPLPKSVDTSKLPKRGARRAAAGSSEPVEPKA